MSRSRWYEDRAAILETIADSLVARERVARAGTRRGIPWEILAESGSWPSLAATPRPAEVRS